MSCESGRDPDELAVQIIDRSRRMITRQAPFLLRAVYAMGMRRRELPGPISTDGVFLWYHPDSVLEDARRDNKSVAEQILHVTIHCLLGHLGIRERFENAALFDVLADCKTAMFASSLGCSLGSLWELWVPGSVETENSALPAMYRALENSRRRCGDLIREVSGSGLCMDDHRLWNPKGAVLTENAGAGREKGGEKPDWTRIADEICEQYGHGERWGHLPGQLKADCTIPEENDISYTEFLRQFAAPQERLYSDPDSIDARWYHLGLEQYGDIPLLEPCELSEPVVSSDLVIALDTSGSCSGEICSRFLRETCNLLRDIAAGAASLRVLLLQCDCDIRKELLVSSPEELEQLWERFAPEGFGGTDFCPVFQRVEELRDRGEMKNMRGLIYLSDGYGPFPNRQPDYPVAFILADEEGSPAANLPHWVRALYLNEHDFVLREVS